MRVGTNHANDKQELLPGGVAVDPTIREIAKVCTDTGYLSEEAVRNVEDSPSHPVVYYASALSSTVSIDLSGRSSNRRRCSSDRAVKEKA